MRSKKKSTTELQYFQRVFTTYKHKYLSNFLRLMFISTMNTKM